MKAFFDTNVLMDILDDERPNNHQVQPILQVAFEGEIDIVLSTQSIVDAAYIYTQAKKQSALDFRAKITGLLNFVCVQEVSRSDIDFANRSSIPDYEDAVQLSCALRSDCGLIVTGDKKFHGYTDLPVYTVSEFFVALFGS